MITFDYLNFILSEAKKSKKFVGPRMSGSYDRYFLPFHADIESKWEKFNDEYKKSFNSSLTPPESTERIWTSDDERERRQGVAGKKVKQAQPRGKGSGTKGKDLEASYGVKFKNKFNKLIANTLGFFSFDAKGKKNYANINFYGQLMAICSNQAKILNSRLKFDVPLVFGGMATRLWSTERQEVSRGVEGGAGILNPESEQNKEIKSKWIVSKDSSGRQVGHLDPKDFNDVADTLRANARNAAKNFIENEDLRFRRESGYSQDSKGRDVELDPSSKITGERESIGKVELAHNMYELFKKYIDTRDEKFYDDAKNLWDNIKSRERLKFRYSGEWQRFIDEVKGYPKKIANEKLAELSRLGMGAGTEFKTGYGSRRAEVAHRAFIDKVKRRMESYVNFYELISDPNFYNEVQKMAIDNYEEMKVYNSGPTIRYKFLSNDKNPISNYVRIDFVNALLKKYPIFSQVDYSEPLNLIKNFVQESLNDYAAGAKKLPKMSGNALRGYKQTIEKFKEAGEIADIVLSKGEGQELSASELVKRSVVLGKPMKLDRATELVTLVGKIQSQTEINAEDLIPGDFEVPEKPSYKPQVEIDPDYDTQFADIQAKAKEAEAKEQEKINKQYNADIEKVQELEKEDDEREKKGEPRMYVRDKNLPLSQRGDDIDLGKRGTYLGDLSNFGVPVEPLATLRKRIKALGHLVVYGPSAIYGTTIDYGQEKRGDYESGPEVEFGPSFGKRGPKLLYSPTDPEYKTGAYTMEPAKYYPGGKARTSEYKPRKVLGMARKYDNIMRDLPDPVMTKPPTTLTTTVTPPRGKFSWSDVSLRPKTSIEPIGSIEKTTGPEKNVPIPGKAIDDPLRFTRFEGYRNAQAKWKPLLEHIVDSKFPWMR
jgi:hypothetical protein